MTVLAPESQRLAELAKLQSMGAMAAERLVEMLTDPSWIVRRQVVESLLKLGPSVAPLLCDLLRTSRGSEARIAAAVDTLSALAGNIDGPLLALAQAKDPAVVADAIQVIGRRRRRALVPVLKDFTSHEDDIIAVSAIEALGRIGGQAAIETLIQTISSNVFFRTYPAIDILGRSGDPRVVSPLAALLSNPTYLPEAAKALAQTGSLSAFTPLAELLKSPNTAVLRVALVAIENLQIAFKEKSVAGQAPLIHLMRSTLSEESVFRIARALSMLSAEEKIAAFSIFGILGKEEALPILTDHLSSEPSVSEAAARALKIVDNSSEQALITAISTGDSPRRLALLPLVTKKTSAASVAQCLSDRSAEVRALCCETLARLGNAEVLEPLFQMLADSNLHVVHAATAAIQTLGNREARNLAILKTASPQAMVRRAALRILSYFGGPDATAALLNALKDADLRVREVALLGLPLLNDPNALAALLREAKGDNPKNRALAIRALGSAEALSPEGVAALLQALSDADPWVRYYSCQAVGKQKVLHSASALAERIYDEAGQVKVAALEALSHLDSPVASQALRDAADDPDLDLRRAALVGLGLQKREGDLPLLLKASRDADNATKLIALSSLNSFQNTQALQRLIAALFDSEEQIKDAAINLLALRPEPEASTALASMINPSKAGDRIRLALTQPSPGRLAGLLVAMGGATDENAFLIASILGRLPNGEGKRGLLSAMLMPNPAARKAAATLLGSFKDSEVLETLAQAAENDPDEGVRAVSALVLEG